MADNDDADDDDDKHALHHAVRARDIGRVEYLVDVAKYPIDEPDDFNATPLYLAALTGNEDICRFLLERGARCDPPSSDGASGESARVFYVALTPSLRSMLREYSLSAASSDPLIDILRKFYNNADAHPDCIVRLPNNEKNKADEVILYVHRAIIWARSQCLFRCLRDIAPHHYDCANGDWPITMELQLPAQLDTEIHVGVAKNLVEYLYTGSYICLDKNSTLLAEQMASEFGFDYLSKLIGEKTADGRKYSRCVISDKDGLRRDMKRLAEAVSMPLSSMSTKPEVSSSLTLSGYSEDVTIKCNDFKWFPLHRFVLCERSDYFARALNGPFREASSGQIDLSQFVRHPHVLTLALQWMYTDTFLNLSTLTMLQTETTKEPISAMDLSLNLLDFASAILCPKLAQSVLSAMVVPSVDATNVFDALELAKLHADTRLEERCARIIAANIQKAADKKQSKNGDIAWRKRLLEALQQEMTETKQGGNVNVTDVPLAAEIRREIREKKNFNDNGGGGKKEQKFWLHLELLEGVLKEALERA